MARILTSWKEIAAYTGKGVRTVQRWEAKLGLPVRRTYSRKGSIVVAVPAELDQWLGRSRPIPAISNLCLPVKHENPFLNGWREIAAHLGKGVRTAQRWEKEFCLPVKRLNGGNRGKVTAVAKDLDDWVSRNFRSRERDFVPHSNQTA